MINLCFLSLFISCSSNPDLAIENCFNCEISGSDSIVLRVNHVFDTIWFSSYDLSNYEIVKDFAACNLPDDLPSLENQSIITSKVNLYEACNGTDYIEILEFDRIEDCHPKIDTLDFEANLSGNWRVHSLNNYVIPCELESSFLIFDEKEEETYSMSVFQLSGSALLKSDTVLLFDQVVSLVVYPTTNANNFSGLITDFFWSEEKSDVDTTKLIYEIDRNILQIKDPQQNATLTFYKN